MQKVSILKQLLFLLFALLLSTSWAKTDDFFINDGFSNIALKARNLQGSPKDSSIQASINGHSLTVVFLENLGEVLIEITTDTGGTVDLIPLYTPNGYLAYIVDTGSYIINFTLENGDEYYGEFEVMN